MDRTRYAYLLIMLAVLLSGCDRKQTVCPTEEEASQPKLQLADVINLPSPTSTLPEPVEVIIAGRKTKVDKVVDYPLCNDTWSGTVYVSCDVQVAEAELDEQSNPLFLKGCNLNIAPNTVVYVAAHNDAAYYKGCSCHTGLVQEP